MKADGRGRPVTFQLEERQRLAELIQVYGARPTKDLAGVPISVPTLLKIAKEFDINLKKGRRSREAA